MKFIKKYGYSITLGALLGLVNETYYFNWQLYAIMIPVIILVEWKVNNENK